MALKGVRRWPTGECGVRSFDLFHFYRYLLTLLVTIYATIRLAQSIWRWQGWVARAQGGSALMCRYFAVLLLRARVRRFLYELVVIGGLASALLLLILRHWR